jgi:hypothetical protein
MVMYLEMLKALVTLGIVVKAIGARFWLATVTALAMLYFTAGLIAVHAFGKRFPPITAIVAAHPTAIVAASLVAPVALFGLARVKRLARPAWREVGDLCLLAGIIEAIQQRGEVAMLLFTHAATLPRLSASHLRLPATRARGAQRACGGLAMTRALVMFAVVAISGVARAKPAAIHADAIPDGDRWICFVWDDGMHHVSGCERDRDLCYLALSNFVRAAKGTVKEDTLTEGRCVKQPTAWVATAMRANGAWTRVAAPTATACVARVVAEFAQLRAVSSCVEVARTSPGVPDPALVPAGRGWWCIDKAHDEHVLGSRCFRQRAQCPGLLALPSTPCHEQATAWLYTDGVDSNVFRDQTTCDEDRVHSLDRSACVESK